MYILRIENGKVWYKALLVQDWDSYRQERTGDWIEIPENTPDGEYLVDNKFYPIVRGASGSLWHIWEDKVVPCYHDGVLLGYPGEVKIEGLGTSLVFYGTASPSCPLFTSREAAEAALARIKEARWHTAYIAYGSAFYGESADRDFLLVSLQGEAGRERLEVFRALNEGRAAQLPFGTPDDHLPLRDTVPARLAWECARVEYDGFEGLVPPPLPHLPTGEVIRMNAERLGEIARHFPCDFTVRKALFAALQLRYWETNGEFCDCKSKAMAVVDDEIAEVARKLLYHQADDADVRAVYTWLFGQPYPSGVYSLMGHREFVVWNGQELLYSEYTSGYGWERLAPPKDIDLRLIIHSENPIERWESVERLLETGLSCPDDE